MHNAFKTGVRVARPRKLSDRKFLNLLSSFDFIYFPSFFQLKNNHIFRYINRIPNPVFLPLFVSKKSVKLELLDKKYTIPMINTINATLAGMLSILSGLELDLESVVNIIPPKVKRIEAETIDISGLK